MSPAPSKDPVDKDSHELSANNMVHTPKAKYKGGFKSPVPSNKKS